MGRKEERLRNRMEKKEQKRQSIDTEKLLTPFTVGDQTIIPVVADRLSAPQATVDGLMSMDEFTHFTHALSDQELNRLIYQNAKEAVKNGTMPPWPEDESAIILWFTWNFITPEMREAFPAIAKEYLANYTRESSSTGSQPGAIPEFTDIPYPRANEATWDDAYYFRVLLMMLFSARNGSDYSKNFLLALYKVYYRQEYNRVKKLSLLTYLDILEMHDADCLKKGYPSGHTTKNGMSFRDMVIEQRRHEPGWTNAYQNRVLDPIPGKRKVAPENEQKMKQAMAMLNEMGDAPDEPPIQPAAARLIIICQLMGIPIEETCNEQAYQMKQITESMNRVQFLDSPEYRRARDELVERTKEFLKASYPEMFDPYEYQKDPKYLSLQVAEMVMGDVFRKHDTNVRLPYDSCKFDLPSLAADLTITLQSAFPQLQISYDELLILSMVQYLSEALCEVMEARDTQLEEVLHFKRRRAEGEYTPEEKEGQLEERVRKAIGSLRQNNPVPEEEKAEESLDEASMRAELERLRAALAEKEAALAESEQKTIRQRVLYEKERDRNRELEQLVTEREIEHAELIALREHVYNQSQARDEGPEIDEASQEEILAKIRDRKVAVLGGSDKWFKKLKRLLPGWSFIPVGDDNSIGGFNALERADFIYVYTNVLQHAQYYRAINLAKSKGKMLFYLGNTNISENLRQFERELCR